MAERLQVYPEVVMNLASEVDLADESLPLPACDQWCLIQGLSVLCYGLLRIWGQAPMAGLTVPEDA